MFLNGYSVRVEGKKEMPGGYVHMGHGETFKLTVGNRNDTRCNCTISLDGKEVGTWRLERGQTATIERPANEKKLFTFYRADSSEGKTVGADVGKIDQGLITVEFIPEDTTVPSAILRSAPNQVFFNSGVRGMSANNVTFSACSAEMKTSGTISAGVSGLSGHSSQEFSTAYRMKLDYEATQAINLRLVIEDEAPAAIRPLSATRTVIPPAV